MKKLILIIISFIISSNILYSQIKNETERSDYWNMAYSGGTLLSFIDRVDKDNELYPGYNAGFEMFCDINSGKSAIVINLNYGRIKKHPYNLESVTDYMYTEYFELTFGPRFNIGKGYFVESLLGNYAVNNVTNMSKQVGLEYYPGSLINTSIYFGASAGAGIRIKLSDDFDAIIKGRVNFLLAGHDPIVYAGLNTGIVFNNKIDPETDIKYSKKGSWSVTISGGISNPELFRNDEYRVAPNFGIEGAYRSSPRFEAYGNIDYNGIVNKSSVLTDRRITDIIFGPRFFIGPDKYLSFFEIGTGLYFDYYNIYSVYERDNIYAGVNIGTGVIISLNEHIGFPLKGKMHLMFNDRNHPGGFLTASGGLRYTL